MAAGGDGGIDGVVVMAGPVAWVELWAQEATAEDAAAVAMELAGHAGEAAAVRVSGRRVALALEVWGD
ncbi:MAG: hypothetical protein R3F65_10760 [bacterium]